MFVLKRCLYGMLLNIFVPTLLKETKTTHRPCGSHK